MDAHSPIPPLLFSSSIIKTPRLLLRPLRTRDAGALFDIYSDPRVCRFLVHPPWKEIRQAHEFLARDFSARDSRRSLRFAIEVSAEGVLAGECALFNLHDASRRAETGLAIASRWWGKGLAFEAMEALVEFAMDDMGLNRLEADVDPRNAASARVLQKLGFRLEGHMPERWLVEGEPAHTDFYGLLARDWRRR